MLGQSLDQEAAVEAFVDDSVEQHHDVADLVLQTQVDDLEVVLGIEHVQVLNHFVVGDVPLTERGCLVEDGEGIAHTAVSLLGDDGEGLFLEGDAFLLCHALQMVDGVADGHALEVVDLATAEDGGEYLVLLGGGENEDDVCRGFLEGLQERIEGSGGEHVDLVDDEHLVTSQLRRDARLLHEGLDMLHGVVAGGIELEDIE